MPLSKDQIFDLLKSSSVFCDIPEDEISRLSALARQDYFPDRTLLISADTHPEQIWYVLDGSIQTGIFSQSGKLASLPPIARGQWTPWMGCFLDTPLPHEYWCDAQSRLLSLPTKAIRAIAQRHPQIYLKALKTVAGRLNGMISWYLASRLLDPEKQLAYLLAGLYPAGQTDQYTLTLSLEQIAAMGFGTRQRVARILARLENRGLLQRGFKSVSIFSRRDLVRFSTVA